MSDIDSLQVFGISDVTGNVVTHTYVPVSSLLGVPGPHTHSAGDVSSSTFALARLGGGTTNISTFLDGTSNFSQPSFSSLANMPTLGTAASTAAANYASSTHHISSTTHTFPGGATVFLRGDGVFATPAGGASNISTIRISSLASTTTTSTLPLSTLVFSLATATTYRFEFGVVYAAAISSTGLRVGLRFVTMSTMAATVDIPNATQGTAGTFHGWIAASTLTHQSTFTASSVVAANTPLASTKYIAFIYGACVPAAAGTLQVTYATEVAGSAISTFVGTYGTLETIP